MMLFPLLFLCFFLTRAFDILYNGEDDDEVGINSSSNINEKSSCGSNDLLSNLQNV